MMEKQRQYCEEHGVPFFVPYDGRCCDCRKLITDRDDKLITGCEHCQRSFCE